MLNKVIYKCAKQAGLRTQSKSCAYQPGPLWMDDELRKIKSKYRYCVSKFRKCKPNIDLSMFFYCKSEMLKAKEI